MILKNLKNYLNAKYVYFFLLKFIYIILFNIKHIYNREILIKLIENRLFM